MKNKYFKIHFLSFLLPILLFLVIMLLLKIFPFGDKTLLTLDLNSQYLTFFSYLKEIVNDPTALFYSFSKTLGGENFGLISYYCLSPINIISLFFTTEHLPIAITIMTLIKIGLAGLSFNYFLNDKKYDSLLFSTSFALMSFIITYYSNLPWLDSIILIPIIAKGIDKIVKQEKSFIYIISLTLGIIFNYYIGFMLCIFSFIYFLYKLILTNSLTKKQIKEILIHYFISSILVIGLTSIILIPTYYSLQSNKQILDFNRFELKFNMSILDLISKFVTGSFDFNEIIRGLPNIFCGSLIILLNFMYFSSTDRTKKEKILSLSIILIFITSFIIQPLNLIWHGFSAPNWFPYRYSFILSFFLIYFAYLGFLDFKNKKYSRNIYLLLSLIFISLIALLFTKSYSYLSPMKITFTLVIILILCFVLLFSKTKLLFIIVAVDLCLNGYLILREQNFESFSEYKKFVHQYQPLIEMTKKLDNDFYRIEKTNYRSHNDSLLLDYSGMSHNSSAETNISRYYLNSMLGFSSEDNWVHYNIGTTYSNDSLLGIKYILTDLDLSNIYNKVDEANGIFLYHNPYALPLGVVVSENVYHLDLQEFSWFNNQNEIWKSFSSKFNYDIMKKINIEKINLHDVSQSNDNKLSFTSVGDDPYVELMITPLTNDPIFFYMNSSDEKQVKVFANGQFISDYFTYGQDQILRIGEFTKNDPITVKIQLSDSSLSIDNINIFYQDMSLFKQYYQEVTSDKFKLTSFLQAYISGDINSSKDGVLMFNIPYDDGWKVIVDGNYIKNQKAINFFLSVPINEGNHSITLYYLPRGILKGLVVTLTSVLGLFIYMRISSKRY